MPPDRGGGILSGKLTLGKILPGKNSVPKLKNGVKILSPRGLEGKKEIRREAPDKFMAYILRRWQDEMGLFLKTAGKILSWGLKPW